jgi:hypothetical protein
VNLPSRVSHGVNRVIEWRDGIIEEEEVVRRCRVVIEKRNDTTAIESNISRKRDIRNFSTKEGE